VTIEEHKTEPGLARERPPMIRSVDRAARILKVLASGRHLGVTDIAKRLQIPAPTVHGLLRTLHAHGFVEQDRALDKYKLGAGLLYLGSSYLDVNDLRARAIHHAAGLAGRANAAVRVGVLLQDEVLVIHHAFRPDHTLQVPEVGMKLPAHASALGKAMLAFGDPERVDDLLADERSPLTNRTLDAAALRAQLAEVVDTGVAFEREEAVLGESSLAAPIFDEGARVVGAIAVVGDSATLLPRGRPRTSTVTALIGAARGVSRDLGAAEWPPRAAS
jgi:DNA-binding IclR family transcriptional regulator